MIKKNVKALLLITSFLFLFVEINAQSIVIPLLNSSFEKSVARNNESSTGIFTAYYVEKLALNWEDCGGELFPRESPPSVFTSEEAFFGVTQKAADGHNFLCMVVRENGSWESFSQTLMRPMLANQCYAFKLKMSQSPVFKSRVRSSPNNESSFTKPIVLKIWGGDGSCDRKELLAISPFVNNKDWMSFVFYLSPKSALQSITFEAFHGGGSFKFPNGHILMDDLSPLVPIDCNNKNEVPRDLPWTDYELNLANIKTVDDLSFFIKDMGANLEFRSNARLSEVSKNNLNEMVKAMQKFPEHKIVFLFSGAPKFSLKKKIRSIENRMIINDFSESQYEIRKMSREDKKKKIPYLIIKNGMYISLEAL